MRRVEGRLLALLVVVVMVVVMGGEEQVEGGGTEEVEERSLEVDSEIEGMVDETHEGKLTEEKIEGIERTEEREIDGKTAEEDGREEEGQGEEKREADTKLTVKGKAGKENQEKGGKTDRKTTKKETKARKTTKEKLEARETPENRKQEENNTSKNQISECSETGKEKDKEEKQREKHDTITSTNNSHSDTNTMKEPEDSFLDSNTIAQPEEHSFLESNSKNTKTTGRNDLIPDSRTTTPNIDDSNLCQCDSERPSHRSRRFITYTGIGIGALALLVFAFFVKYLLYFTIRKYHEGDSRMLKDDLHFLTSLITHLEESY